MQASRKTKQYSSAAISVVEIKASSAILAGSIINGSTVQAMGQEIGASYNFSEDSGIDSKSFNHEWE